MADSAPTTRQILDQEHPERTAMLPLWRRYRDFGESIDTEAEKAHWLPQGAHEGKATYQHRLRISHDLGLSPSAITRLTGALLRGAAVRDYSDAENAEDLRRFDAQAGGVGVTIDHVLGQGLEEALKMGRRIYFVGREATPGAVSAAEEAIPYVEAYDVEEVMDWDEDARTGTLKWIVLRRTVSRRDGPVGVRGDRVTWLVVTTETVERFEASADGTDAVSTGVVPHGLGVVPVVVHHAHRLGVMRSRSAIDALTRADLRALQLGSDNAISSFLHGNPRLKIKSSRPLSEISADASRVLMLDGEANEDAEYVQLDATGMSVREEMLERGDRRAAGLANMDPGSFSTDGDLKARSGYALSRSFSSAEAPTLDKFHESLVSADVAIHEVVARYLATRGTRAAPGASVFRGKITRPKEWDFMEVGDLVELATAVWPKVKSETWRREAAKQIATRSPGNLAPEATRKILAELDRADYSDEGDASDSNQGDDQPTDPA